MFEHVLQLKEIKGEYNVEISDLQHVDCMWKLCVSYVNYEQVQGGMKMCIPSVNISISNYFLVEPMWILTK